MPKPRNNKKKFIDPKRERTATFAVIHRSQRDPLAADDEAPQRLLQCLKETVPDGHEKRQENKKKVKELKEEERKFGVFYDDEYNYMQHLKDRGAPEYDWSEMDKFLIDAPKDTEQSNVKLNHSNNLHQSSKLNQVKSSETSKKLPPIVFGSKGQEENVGLLNKAAPTGLSDLLEWDPDIVETLDDNFKHEVVYKLKDEENEGSDMDLDEFLCADANTDDDEYEDVEDDVDSDFGYGGRSEDEEDDILGDLNGGREFMFADEETKSRFTTYSMSSSVIRRNKQLSLVDDKFEEFMAEYDDENVGGLELDEIEGAKAEKSETMKQLLGEFNKLKEEERQKPPEPIDSSNHFFESLDTKDKVETDLLEIDDGKKDRWDCESILSTYSTLYNRPKVIVEDRIKVCGKTGIPKNVLGKSGLTESALKKLNRMNNEASVVSLKTKGGSETDDDGESSECDDTQTIASRISAISFRNKHETPEEKKARKNAVKELKKERRAEKKANKTAFQDEKRKQEKIEICNQKNAQVANGKRLV